ncbi:MAG: hypothetical protein AAB690_00165 [Patescibacteria group bacterium]|mgnify:FL=1
MPHVSKRRVDADIFDSISAQLSRVFKLANNRELIVSLIGELFTKTEKVMLAKHLAAILLLYRNVPQHVICEKLRMSPSTIARLSLDVEHGKYQSVFDVVKKDKNKILDILIEILAESIPRPFSNRRSWLGSIYRNR